MREEDLAPKVVPARKQREKARTKRQPHKQTLAKFAAKTSDDDQLLLCERCESHVCIACADITGAEYAILQESARLHWFCEDCQNPTMSASRAEKLIEGKCLELFFSDFRQTSLDDAKKVISGLKADLENLKIAQTEAVGN